MISLTYMSTAVHPFSPVELAALLRAVRDRNHAAGLTGMLLHAGGHFIQTLEGSADAVEATYARIAHDPRHRDLLIALNEDIESRSFPDWSMGFESLSEDEASTLPGFTDYLDTRSISRDSGRELGRAGVFHRVFRDRMR